MSISRTAVPHYHFSKKKKKKILRQSSILSAVTQPATFLLGLVGFILKNLKICSYSKNVLKNNKESKD